MSHVYEIWGKLFVVYYCDMASQEERRNRLLKRHPATPAVALSKYVPKLTHNRDDTRGRFFRKDSEVMKEMFAMRERGMSYTAIAQFYGKDHTTIMYHCKRNGIYPGGGKGGGALKRDEAAQFVLETNALQKQREIDFWKNEIRKIKAHRMATSKYQAKFDEPKAQGKMYAEYLKEKGIKLSILEDGEK